MTKIKTLNVRLNPEKIVDKEIHEIERLKAAGDPYVKDNLKASETPENEPEPSVSSKERLQGGFSAFSDNDI